MGKINNYLVTESEVFTGKSQTETLPYSDSVALFLQARNRPVGITECALYRLQEQVM